MWQAFCSKGILHPGLVSLSGFLLPSAPVHSLHLVAPATWLTWCSKTVLNILSHVYILGGAHKELAHKGSWPGNKTKQFNIKIRYHPKRLDVQNAGPPLEIVLTLAILVWDAWTTKVTPNILNYGKRKDEKPANYGIQRYWSFSKVLPKRLQIKLIQAFRKLGHFSHKRNIQIVNIYLIFLIYIFLLGLEIMKMLMYLYSLVSTPKSALKHLISDASSTGKKKVCWVTACLIW